MCNTILTEGTGAFQYKACLEITLNALQDKMK